MLTRHTKAYSSSCSQIIFVYLQPFRRNSFSKCEVAAEDHKKNNKIPYFGSSGSFKVIDVDTTKKLVTMLHLIGSIPMPVCNCFHARLANSGKITNFTGVPLFDALLRRFP